MLKTLPPAMAVMGVNRPGNTFSIQAFDSRSTAFDLILSAPGPLETDRGKKGRRYNREVKQRK